MKMGNPDWSITERERMKHASPAPWNHLGQPFDEYISTPNLTSFVGCKLREDGRAHLLLETKVGEGMI